jgi:heterodisulfide reductase subunit C
MAEAIKIDNLDIEFKEDVLSKVPDANFDLCLTCGTCTGGCPASELMDMDPRKLIRMINLGMDEAVLKSDWKWVCSMCARCLYACPMKINIPALVFNLRANVPRKNGPGGF